MSRMRADVPAFVPTGHAPDGPAAAGDGRAGRIGVSVPLEEYKVVIKARIRSSPHDTADMLGFCLSGEMVSGSRTGEWLALAGRRGFIRRHWHDGERILVPIRSAPTSWPTESFPGGCGPPERPLLG